MKHTSTGENWQVVFNPNVILWVKWSHPSLVPVEGWRQNQRNKSRTGSFSCILMVTQCHALGATAAGRGHALRDSPRKHYCLLLLHTVKALISGNLISPDWDGNSAPWSPQSLRLLPAFCSPFPAHLRPYTKACSHGPWWSSSRLSLREKKYARAKGIHQLALHVGS